MTTEPICELCDQPISAHVIFHSEEPRDHNLTQAASFPGLATAGFYCPNGVIR